MKEIVSFTTKPYIFSFYVYVQCKLQIISYVKDARFDGEEIQKHEKEEANFSFIP